MLNVFQTASAEALREVRDEMSARRTSEVFLLFPMGSQFDHLIKQQLERHGVFCLTADPKTVKASDVEALRPIGIIVSGGPASVETEAPPFDNSIFDLGIPVLGICLGFQMWASHRGARVRPDFHREFGRHPLFLVKECPLFRNVPNISEALQSHGDKIEASGNFSVVGYTENTPVAAGQEGHLYGVQFHPEVTATDYGSDMFWNFCFDICGAKDIFPAKSIAEEKIMSIRENVKNGRVLLALSGGSDSATVAYLLKHALGENGPPRVKGVYIRGIDRPDDEASVRRHFGNVPWLELEIVDASAGFLKALEGKKTMKEKRIAMRGAYKEILEYHALVFQADWIAQGTLYTDLSESGLGHVTGARKAVIKLHHNTNLGFTLPELTPLDDCVKDGGRNIGRAIAVPEELLARHPFPGPGLVVRIEGEVNEETLRVAREADRIYIEELRNADLYSSVWQAGAVVTQSTTTCTKGDDAASGAVIALWAVWSVNGFTAEWAELPMDFLRRVSRRMTNEIREVGAVVYRISDKPPATIEWG